VTSAKKAEVTMFMKINYFRLSSTATATDTVIPTMGKQCKALPSESTQPAGGRLPHYPWERQQ